jgi:ornithine cyclodeaminase/alanine dehydrogenase-like protein (mu-crystallin family)
MVLYIGEERIRDLLHWDQLIPAVETALVGFSLGRTVQPVRQMLTIEEGKRYLGVMPVADDAMGAKLVSFYPGNAGTGLPTHLAMILLFRPDTGEPLARHGRPFDYRNADSRGFGGSDETSVGSRQPRPRPARQRGSSTCSSAALSRVRRFEEVRVWSRTADHAACFAEQNGAKAVNIEEAVRDADVIVTATNALEPILKGAWLKPGAHVNGVGSPRPTWRELDDDVMANTVIVDSRAAVHQEAGDVILSGATIYAEIGEIFAGSKRAAGIGNHCFQIGRPRRRRHRDGKIGL